MRKWRNGCFRKINLEKFRKKKTDVLENKNASSFILLGLYIKVFSLWSGTDNIGRLRGHRVMILYFLGENKTRLLL